jgi:hypothetical protein
VVISVPVASLMAEAATLMKPDGMLVLFAGVPNGTLAPLDLSHVYRGNAQYTGTSGLTLDDQRQVMERALSGSLSPERVVAAIGGLKAAREGLEALIAGKYPGKIVIFPRYVLTGAALGLYFGYFSTPVREELSLLVVAGLSLLAALLLSLLRLRRPENRAAGPLLRYALRTWLTFALFLAMLEGRHIAYDLGGRLATVVFTTIAGAGLGWWYARTAEQESP